MKLRVDFGINGPRREVNWYQDIKQFPHLLKYESKNWEFVMYDRDPTAMFDYILMFSAIPSYHPNAYATAEDFELKFGGRNGCECGSIYSSAPQFHMFFCPMWRKQ